jgi:hypothetical protein
MRPRAGAVRLQPWEAIEGWRDGRSGSMAYDDVRAGKALAHGSFRRTGDANLPVVSSGGASPRKPGLGLRAAWASRHNGCEPLHETVFCSRYLRRLASAPLGEQNCHTI